MKRLLTALLLLLPLASTTLSAAPAWAGSPRQLASNAGGISLDQAAEQVRRQTGGRILSAETINRNGERVHRIKVLTPERKVEVREIAAGGR